MKVNTQSKTNPQLNNKSGMENFLQHSTSSKEEKQIQTGGEMKTNNQLNQKTNSKESEIERLLNELEEKLRVKTLDFSMFNKIAYEKKLIFKLLLIRDKIYLRVRDEKGEKNTTIAVELPRWGGTSIRYLVNNCLTNECVVIERNTSKGKILTYSPISSGKSSPESDIDDIFE